MGKFVENYMVQFSDEEKQKVFDENAIKFYNLNPKQSKLSKLF